MLKWCAEGTEDITNWKGLCMSRGKYLGVMINGYQDNELVVSCWDCDWENDQEREDKIEEIKSRWLELRFEERYENDPMPKWKFI
jgi:hypothetical protein